MNKALRDADRFIRRVGRSPTRGDLLVWLLRVHAGLSERLELLERIVGGSSRFSPCAGPTTSATRVERRLQAPPP